MFKLLNKSIKSLLKKSLRSCYSFAQYFSFGNNCNYVRTTLQEDILLYYSNSTVRDAIKKKTNLGSALKPIIRNKKTQEEVKNHSVLKLLNNPSFAVSFKEFMTQFIKNYEITANNFNILTFKLRNKEPSQIFNIKPDQITAQYGSKGKVIKYVRNVYSSNDEVDNQEKTIIEYLRTRVLRPTFRILFKDKKGNQFWHSAEYNPLSDGIFGKSKISTLYDEITGIILALRHNRKLIENGCSPTGLLISKNTVDIDEFTKLQENFNKAFSGSNKAGKTIMLQGELEYKETHITPREMDWINGSEYMDKRIYKLFGIPDALVSEKSSTFNNVQQAKGQMYEWEIFPMLDKIYGELTDLLMPHYKDSEELEIYYSKENIPSLDAIKTESTLNKSKTGIYTIDELRAENGLEELPDGKGKELAGMRINSSKDSDKDDKEKPDNEDDKVNKYFFDLMKKEGYNKKQTNLMIKDLEKEGLL